MKSSDPHKSNKPVPQPKHAPYASKDKLGKTIGETAPNAIVHDKGRAGEHEAPEHTTDAPVADTTGGVAFQVTHE